MKKNKSKKKGFLKFLKIFVAVIVVIAAVTAAVNFVLYKKEMSYAASFKAVENGSELVPTVDENGYYTFTTDRDFRILQLSDVHIGCGWMSFGKDKMSLNAVAALITAEKPDLVVVTGDISYPVPFQAGTFNNKISSEVFIELMESLGVYWTVIFGNHDSESYSYYSTEAIAAQFADKNLKYCLFSAGPEDVDGQGNHIINVRNSQGKLVQSLVMMDSHSYTDGDYFGIFWKYDNIHENQIEWYKNEIAALSEGGETVKSLLFIHIPPTAMKTAYDEYLANGETENVKYVYGEVNEKDPYVYCPIHDDGFFEVLLSVGSTQGIFFGHDHLNNIALNYKGIQMAYTKSIDYLAYPGISKEGDQRGGTLITIDVNGGFESQLISYYDAKYVSQYEKEEVTLTSPAN